MYLEKIISDLLKLC